MKRSELKRTSTLRAKQWGVSSKPRKPLAAINVEATKKRMARRAKARRSPENKAVMAQAWIDANGICQCGCGLPFDTSEGQYGPGYPEFDHLRYDPPEGKYVRRDHHQRREMLEHPTRAARRKAVGL